MAAEKRILLFVDATVRPSGQSRTGKLCGAYLEAFCAAHPEYEVHRLELGKENLLPNCQEDLAEREHLIREGKMDSPVFCYAREFAQADHILIGAPYWDLSFPALLKVYIEKICVGGITFVYTETGVKPLCRAGRMTYLTTSGGMIGDMDFGSEYLSGLCSALFGIPVFERAAAEGLDIDGADCSQLMEEACSCVRRMAQVGKKSFAAEHDRDRNGRRPG